MLLRVYGPQAAVDQWLTDYPAVTVSNNESQPEAHPGEFLGTVDIPEDEATLGPAQNAMMIAGISCDDFPDWA